MIVVPCAPAGQAFWTQRSALGGSDYLLTFRWNQRDGHWLLDVADTDGAPIASGCKLVTAWPLLRGVVDARRPAGLLIVLDATGANDLDPGFGDLGARFLLAYFDPGERP